MISGYDDFSYVQDALRLGVSDYILKPVKASILNDQLEKCVEKIKKKRNKTNNGLDLNFVSSEYSSYIDYRVDWINNALLSGSEDKINEEFDILEEQIQIKFSEIQRRDFIIYFYYRLLYNLQNYIIGCGYLLKQIFSSKFTSFVFDDDTKFIRMLTYLRELYVEANMNLNEFKLKRNKLDISKIKDYLSANYLEEVSLERTAELFSVSKEYLSKIYKEEYKISFSKFIIKLRMEKAMQLVLDSSIPLKKIPEASGFIDQSHFYKTFKKYWVKTPGDIRATLKKHNETD